MKKPILIPAFILMVLVQLYVPVKMIFNKEAVLAEGKDFRFKTAPVDPHDPFRGKYIDLFYEANAVQMTNVMDWNYGDRVFVILKNDEKGFAQIETVTKERPEPTTDYVNAMISYIIPDSLSTITIQYPFERFYMEESKAYSAEQAYNEASRDTTQVTYAIVSIKEGDAVVKDVLINGVPIRAAAEQWQDDQQF